MWVRGRAITWVDSVSRGVLDPDGRMFAASSEIRVNSPEEHVPEEREAQEGTEMTKSS